MAVVSHINRQGGFRLCTLNRHARQLLLWAQDKFLSMRAVHIPGVLNLAADFMSRQKLRSGEWTFGAAEMHLFVSQESTQCPLWFSLSHPTSLGIDALAHPWSDMNLHAFPPVKLIPAELCRVKTYGVRLLLVARSGLLRRGSQSWSPFWRAIRGRFQSGKTCCVSFREEFGTHVHRSGSCGYGWS